MIEALKLSLEDLASDILNLSAPIRLRRRGVEAKLVLGTTKPRPDPVLTEPLREAQRQMGGHTVGTPISEVARTAGHHDAFIRTRGSLAFLSPKIQVAMRDGTLPPELTLRRLMRHPIPLDWQEQERIFGI